MDQDNLRMKFFAYECGF